MIRNAGMFAVGSACAALTTTTPAQIVIGIDEGGVSRVAAFERLNTPPTHSFLAYPGFSGGVRVAVGDVTGDGVADIITAAGPGGGPHVNVQNLVTGIDVRPFFAYNPAFTGGVHVAAGDVNGDGLADIITGAGAGSPGGHVKVFDGVTNGELHSFFAFGSGFTGGVRVAAGDVNGDGRTDVIVGAGPGAPGGHVKVFDGRNGAEIRSFFAFETSFSGGVFVAAGDLDGDGAAEVIVGPDAQHAPVVRLFSGADLNMREIPLNIPQSNDGVRVGVHFNPQGSEQGIIAILVGVLVDHSFPRVMVLDPQSGQPLQSQLLGSDEYFQKQVFVAGTPPPVPTPVICPADFNGDGLIFPDDLSEFITCFFLHVMFPRSCPRADFNGDGLTFPDDLSEFITTFFIGCE